MNVPIIEMQAEEAEGKARDFERMAGNDPEYKAAALAYRILAQGGQVVDLRAVFGVDRPIDEKGRPKLAIARADRKHVRISWSHRGIVFDARAESRRRSHNHTRSYIGTLRVEITGDSSRFPSGYAIVPMVPADVLIDSSLSRTHFILWEVEAWADSFRSLEPDIDPILLDHIDGDLYEVVATWDLTEIERAVMARRWQ